MNGSPTLLTPSIYISEGGVINLGVRSRKRASLQYAQALGNEILTFAVETAELGTLGCIVDIFGGEEMVRAIQGRALPH